MSGIPVPPEFGLFALWMIASETTWFYLVLWARGMVWRCSKMCSSKGRVWHDDCWATETCSDVCSPIDHYGRNFWITRFWMVSLRGEMSRYSEWSRRERNVSGILLNMVSPEERNRHHLSLRLEPTGSLIMPFDPPEPYGYPMIPRDAHRIRCAPTQGTRGFNVPMWLRTDSELIFDQ
jgi:hypothetical protein